MTDTGRALLWNSSKYRYGRELSPHCLRDVKLPVLNVRYESIGMLRMSALGAKIFEKSVPPSFLDKPLLHQLLVKVRKYGAKALARHASGRRVLHPQFQLFRGYGEDQVAAGDHEDCRD